MLNRQHMIAALAVLGTLGAGDALAADHIEAPGAQADAVADIADFYAWGRDHIDGTVIAAITFAGAGPSIADGVYDKDVLYGIHIDNDADNKADFDVWIRFGQNGAGEWGVQVSGLPGGDEVVSGPVDQVFAAGGDLRVFAGHREDPFFFDLVGFQSTLQTGALAFTGDDYFAGLNVTAVVVEIDADSIRSSDANIQMWSTTSRL